MLVLAALSVMLGGSIFPRAIPCDSPLVAVDSTDTSFARFVLAPTDTPPPHARPKVVEVSDWYATPADDPSVCVLRTIPVFASQWDAGKQLFDKSRDAPTWAKTMHRAGATALAGMFTVNTVTGTWNWWDSRAVPQGKVLRTVHALTMIAVDAAFTYTGAKLSNEAEDERAERREHRTVALYAMGVTVISGAAMKIWNR